MGAALLEGPLTSSLAGQVHHDTHALPMGNYVIVSSSELGNCKIADTRWSVEGAEAILRLNAAQLNLIMAGITGRPGAGYFRICGKRDGKRRRAPGHDRQLCMLPASPYRDKPVGKVVGAHTKRTCVTAVTRAEGAGNGGRASRPAAARGGPHRQQGHHAPTSHTPRPRNPARTGQQNGHRVCKVVSGAPGCARARDACPFCRLHAGGMAAS
jgi:hypothetical protein